MASSMWKDANFLIFLSGTVISTGAYLAGNYLQNRSVTNVDEGFEDVSRIEDTAEKKVLVLGIEGSGKTSLLECFTFPRAFRPTQVGFSSGFHVITLEHEGIALKITEIGGSARVYYENYLQDTDLLVFVVDSSNRLTDSAVELKKVLGDYRLAYVPVLILANKQDLPIALHPEAVANALDLSSIPPYKHSVQVLGTQCPPNAPKIHPSVKAAKAKMFDLMSW